MSASDLISQFQREVAKAFFALPESRGFVLAGGAALIATEVVERRTDDLDFFASRGAASVPAAKDAFLEACAARGWRTSLIHGSDEFVRLSVFGPNDKVEVDMGLDASLLLPPVVTFLGPTVGAEENAGRKTLALFGRFLARDFVDVYRLVERFGKQRLLELAAERDRGFDLWVFAQALHQVGTIRPQMFPIAEDERDSMVAFFDEWAEELRAETGH